MHNNRNNRETVIIPQTIIVPTKSIIVASHIYIYIHTQNIIHLFIKNVNKNEAVLFQ